MDQMIRLIIDMDKQARDMKAAAEERRQNLQKEIERRKKEIQEKYEESLKEILLVTRAEEETVYSAEIKKIDRQTEQLEKELEETCRGNRELWVNRIVAAVLEE